MKRTRNCSEKERVRVLQWMDGMDGMGWMDVEFV